MENYITAEFACLEALHDCLLRERDLMVLLRTDEILENNETKDHLGHELQVVRDLRRDCITDVQLSETRSDWVELNQKVLGLCMSNKALIDRSLSRQALLMENLRKCMMGGVVYSQRGNSVAGKYEGRVVEKRY